MQLIGNAVPPRLAHAIGLQLLRDLVLARPGAESGALLSFDATAAMGMSPALERTCVLVKERFLASEHVQEALPLWD
jgi:hypothetical protein